MRKDLDNYKELFHETTELSGLCRALKYSLENEKNSEKRICLKIILRTSVKQLVTNLHILAGDRQSKVELDKIVEQFIKQYGEHALELSEIDPLMHEVYKIKNMVQTKKAMGTYTA